jgi:hypothetical protein
MEVIAFVKEHLAHFCANTGIHGFVYVVSTKRHLAERLFWLLMIASSFVLTGALTRKLIIENQHNPTIIFSDQNIVPVTDIVFPSISLVPGLIPRNRLKIGFDYVAYKDYLENGQATIENSSMDELKRMQIASLIARDGFMAQFNVTIPTDDFVKHMRENFLQHWESYSVDEDQNIVKSTR